MKMFKTHHVKRETAVENALENIETLDPACRNVHLVEKPLKVLSSFFDFSTVFQEQLKTLHFKYENYFQLLKTVDKSC